MGKRKLSESLFDPRTGGQPIRIGCLAARRKPAEPARTNYFNVMLIRSGSGVVWADSACFAFEAPCLLFFVPYQYIRLEPDAPVEADVIQFHANFLCVETFHAEVGCSGTLFNDPHGVPIVSLDELAAAEVLDLIERLRQEQAEQALAYSEVMVAHLKVLLILATRRKATEAAARLARGMDPRHPLIAEFRELIEQHYRTLHSPGDYARLLHVTPKTLGRIVRENLGTTPTELIRARILTHAKWQLLHTLRPVKEIAREVGFSDELYFSRLFKKATGCSPRFFREFETEIRGGSNLSMFSSEAPIQSSASRRDTASRSIAKT